MTAIIQTHGLTKVFGSNGAAVHALRGHRHDGRARRVRRADRPLGLGQVDAHGDPRLPRQADGRHLRARRRARSRGCRAASSPRSATTRSASSSSSTTCCRRPPSSATSSCRCSTPASRARSGGARALELLERVGIPDKAKVLPGGALGRPAAARRGRARARQPAGAPARRRADRRARLARPATRSSSSSPTSTARATPSSSSPTTSRSPPWRSARSRSTTG